MAIDQFLLLSLLVIAMVGTPGPANMSLLAMGTAHGVKGTLPFFFGTVSGFQAILALNALGLYAVLAMVPGLLGALKLACLAYISYLAYRIATSEPAAAVPATSSRQMAADFVRGFWVHPLNPKAYAMQIAALTQFLTPGRSGVQYLVVALTFLLLGGLLNFAWSAGGGLFNHVARTPARYRVLTVTLAAAMVLSVVLSLFLAPS